MNSSSSMAVSSASNFRTTLLPANNQGPCLCGATKINEEGTSSTYFLGICSLGYYRFNNPLNSTDYEKCGYQYNSAGTAYTAIFTALDGTLAGSGSVYTLSDANSTATVSATRATLDPASLITPAPSVLIVNPSTLTHFISAATTYPVPTFDPSSSYPQAIKTNVFPADNNGPCICGGSATLGNQPYTTYVVGICTAGSYSFNNPADPFYYANSCGYQFTVQGEAVTYTALFTALGGTLTGSGTEFTLADATPTNEIILHASFAQPDPTYGWTYTPSALIVSPSTLGNFLAEATTVSVSGPSSTGTGAAVARSSSPMLGTLALGWTLLGWLL